MITRRIRTTIRLFVATVGLTALVIGLGAGPTAAATGLRNCTDVATDVTGPQAALVGCYEYVWADGAEVRMTFSNQGFTGATPQQLDPFYVVAPQTDSPQGFSPSFPHDHVIRGIPSQNHGTYSVRVQGFFVICTGQGIVSGACVPLWTSPGGPALPFAGHVNGRPLTSADAIESAAAAGLVAAINLGPGAVIVGSVSGN